MKGSEWTLVLFTLFIQTAAGLILTFGLINNFTGWRNSIPGGKDINDKILFIVCALFIAALIISFLHLGNIKNAVYTLSNLTGSWLSREILALSIFGFLTCSFTLLYSRNLLPPAIQNIAGLLAVISGLVLVFVMAKIYMLDVVPAWNNLFTPVSFYLSSFILGGLTFLAAILFLPQNKDAGIINSSEIILIAKIIVGIVTVLVLSGMIIWIYQTISLSGGDRASVESYNLIIKGNPVFFAARFVLQITGLALLIYSYIQLYTGSINEKYIFIAYLLVLLAEILGRYLFYAMYARVGV